MGFEIKWWDARFDIRFEKGWKELKRTELTTGVTTKLCILFKLQRQFYIDVHSRSSIVRNLITENFRRYIRI